MYWNEANRHYGIVNRYRCQYHIGMVQREPEKKTTMENEQQKWHECVFLCIIHSLTFGEAFKSQCFMSSLKKTSCLQFKIEKLVLSHSNRVPLLIFATQHIKVKKKNKNNFSKQQNFSYKHNTNTHTHTRWWGDGRRKEPTTNFKWNT